MSTFKFTAIFGLQPGIDPDATYRKWREEHVLYAKKFTLPEVRKYNINRVVHRFGDTDIGEIWGIPEFWFDDLASVQSAMGRLRDAQPDDFHTDHITPAKRLVTQEEEPFLPWSEAPGAVKLVSICSLQPGVDADEAYRVWCDAHARWARDQMLPELRKYTLNRVIHKYPPAGGTVAEFDIYGYVMAWFDDLESAIRAAERLRHAPPDTFLTQFVTTLKMVIVKEENVAL